MESKKPKIDLKITLYKSIKFIAWITLGFVIGSIFRYASAIYSGVLSYKWFLKDAVLFFKYLLVFFGIMSFITLFFWWSTYKKNDLYKVLAVVTGILPGFAIGFLLIYDGIITSIADVGAIFLPFISGIIGAIVLSIAGRIFVDWYINEKNILNLAYAITIGFTFGFTIGHILVFSILGLI